MIRNDNFAFIWFVVEATPINENENDPNTFKRLLEMNDRINASIALPSGLKNRC